MKNKKLTPEDFIVVKEIKKNDCEGCFFNNNPLYNCLDNSNELVGKIIHKCTEGYIYKLKGVLPKEPIISELDYKMLLIDKKVLIDYLKIAVNLLIDKNTSLEVIVKFKNAIKDFEPK